MTIRRKSPKPLVQSVERAFNLIDYLANKPNGAALSFISEDLDLNISTAHRILTTLMFGGFIVQHSNGRYGLSTKFAEIGSKIVSSLDIRHEARDILVQLATKTQECIHLAMLLEGKVVYVDKIDGPHILRMYSAVGLHAPLHCTGVGKAILAYMPQETIQRIIAGLTLEEYTKNTITEPQQLMDELRRIRDRGYSIDEEEHEVGIRCIAAPIFCGTGQMAAISISGPSARMSRQDLMALIPDITEASKIVSQRMGCQSGFEVGQVE